MTLRKGGTNWAEILLEASPGSGNDFMLTNSLDAQTPIAAKPLVNTNSFEILYTDWDPSRFDLCSFYDIWTPSLFPFAITKTVINMLSDNLSN